MKKLTFQDSSFMPAEFSEMLSNSSHKRPIASLNAALTQFWETEYLSRRLATEIHAGQLHRQPQVMHEPTLATCHSLGLAKALLVSKR